MISTSFLCRVSRVKPTYLYYTPKRRKNQQQFSEVIFERNLIKMKRPLAYITAAWSGNQSRDIKRATRYCREVYEAGYSPICPMLYLPVFLDYEVPEDYKSNIDISRDLLKRSHVLVVCGSEVNEDVKSDIATAARLKITATTLDGILKVNSQLPLKN